MAGLNSCGPCGSQPTSGNVQLPVTLPLYAIDSLGSSPRISSMLEGLRNNRLRQWHLRLTPTSFHIRTGQHQSFNRADHRQYPRLDLL
jgi:hypothetical protein